VLPGVAPQCRARPLSTIRLTGWDFYPLRDVKLFDIGADAGAATPHLERRATDDPH